MPTRAMIAMNAEKTPWKAACTRNGALMNDLVAPTSFIVWIVKRRENTLRRTVLLMRTYEMNRSSAMNTPMIIDILLRFALRASTREL